MGSTHCGKRLFCFGFGYTASFLATRLAAEGWKISGTTTDPDKKAFLKQNGIDALLFDRNRNILDPYDTFKDVTHVLLSVPPDAEGDAVCDMHGMDLVGMKNLEWVGYLSTTAVYGNQDGSWINETTPPAPSSRRGSLRLDAEQQWQSLYMNDGLPLHIFRLAGIYGPGRSAIDSVRSGTAKCVDKPGHAFNRIHIDDIVQVLMASMNAPKPGSIYNLADDEPSPSSEVVQFACNLIGTNAPAMVSFDEAELAPIVRSFYKENKRVNNDKIKSEFGIKLLHPNYRSGLQACLEVENETSELLRFSATEAAGNA